MKTIRKSLALLLSALLLLSLSLVSFAADEPFASSYERQSYVTVKGNAGTENAGYAASLMLVNTDANPSKETIGYIGQTTIDASGEYLFEFSFNGFTYSNGSVDNYEAVLNINGTRMEKTITEASVIEELVEFDLDFTLDNFGKATVNLTNTYGLKDLGYTLIIGFYDGDNKLLSIKRENKYTGDTPELSYTYGDIPAGTVSAKAFLWENTKTLLPLAGADEINVLEYTEGREVKHLTIAPGKDATQRNFAWFDTVHMQGAKLQYAPKTSNTLSENFESSNAKTVSVESGIIDVTEYNGKTNENSSNKFVFNDEYTYAKATATGLAPNTTYVYRIGDQLGWCSGIYEFKTDDPSDGFEFLLFADEHAGNAGGSIVESRKKALETSPTASFIYSMGDLVELPNEENWEEYFDRDGMESIPLAAVAGPTHDMINVEYKASLFGHHFNMPNRSETSGYIENVGSNYWFTYGDTLFIGIIHNEATKDGIISTNDFIEEAIKENPNAKWKILCTHWPFYQPKANGAGGIRDARFYNMEGYGDVLADNGIDLAITAHDHFYFSSYPMYKGIKDITNFTTSTSSDGAANSTLTKSAQDKKTVYLALGTTGWLYDDYNGLAKDEDYMAYADATAYRKSNNATVYHTFFTTVSVKDNILTFKTYRNEHNETTNAITETKVIDTYTITKTE